MATVYIEEQNFVDNYSDEIIPIYPEELSGFDLQELIDSVDFSRNYMREFNDVQLDPNLGLASAAGRINKPIQDETVTMKTQPSQEMFVAQTALTDGAGTFLEPATSPGAVMAPSSQGLMVVQSAPQPSPGSFSQPASPMPSVRSPMPRPHQHINPASSQPAVSSLWMMEPTQSCLRNENDVIQHPKKRGRKPKNADGAKPRRNRPKKLKLYQMEPFEDKEEEKKRKNAVIAWEHRENEKQEKASLKQQLQTIANERDILKQQLQTAANELIMLKQQLQTAANEGDMLKKKFGMMQQLCQQQGYLVQI